MLRKKFLLKNTAQRIVQQTCFLSHRKKTVRFRLYGDMFEISKRLEQANQAANPQEHLEEERVKAGRNAELSFASSLRLKSGLDSSSLFCCLRIPDRYQARKREIDVVVLSADGIFCIEVKCWSGTVTRSEDGSKWIQTRTKQISTNSFTTNHIEHENSMTETEIKARLLREYLSRKEVYLAEKLFHSRVVFCNANVELDENISNHSAVIKPSDHDKFIQSFSRGFLQSFPEAVVPSWISGKLSFSQLNQIRTILSSTGTWDVIQLNGGRQLYGDFRECAGVSLDRQKCEALLFSHQRSRTVGMAWAVFGYSPQVSVSLLERGGTGWIWNSYCASLKIPYNTDVVFRICGEEVDSKIPANDIERISISI
ncbi:hypothetical protein OS493_010687 [Desmophyllum pertusum]|uniref:NERD domain-containing protein n=1 Tax=Desmophyllum pertusum TaxID=174260 RepID=A0A9W9ZR88_9CNID|nr:hypothetical protein OS493_010687 [Desmophyllum pertusum]